VINAREAATAFQFVLAGFDAKIEQGKKFRVISVLH